ncbi:MAG: BLUF domain-containing protein [Halieaceae bacterium]|jgi:hypothetical protein|nr:BLUF domain-containing protein [Halieaceae bacterium]
MSNLYHLAYISKSAILPARAEIEQALRAILRAARQKNSSMGITGALLFSGGYFCQVIEGDLDALETLYETIQMDERHTECTVLFFEPLETRGFGAWDMAFAGIEEEMRFPIEDIKQSHDELAMHETGEQVVAVLSELVAQHQATVDR